MFEYIITIVLPFITNYTYFFLFAALFWFTTLINVKPLERNKMLRIIFRILIFILFIRHLLDITLILSSNISNSNPKISYFLVHVDQNPYFISKLFIGILTLAGALCIFFLGRKSTALPFSKLKFFIYFLILYSILEFLQLSYQSSETLIYITQIMTFTNLFPLIIGIKNVVRINNKNKRFFKSFLFNSIFSLVVILTLGVIVMTILTRYINTSMDKEEAFITRQIENIDINSEEELLSFVSEINEVSNYEITCTGNPKQYINSSKLYLPRTIDLGNTKSNFLVFGSPYKDIHRYIGILFRISISVIIFFNFASSLSYYFFMKRK